jgi:hypothetical protein
MKTKIQREFEEMKEEDFPSLTELIEDFVKDFVVQKELEK